MNFEDSTTEKKNPQWASIASGIIGKNQNMKDSFRNALEKYK